MIADFGLQNTNAEVNGTKSPAENRQTVKREEISRLVDKFLRDKISEQPSELITTKSQAELQNPNGEVKTIIHQVANVETTKSNGARPDSVDFVSEDDVKKAVETGAKIYISPKTIITPSARDLGEEKEIFAKI